MRKSEQTTRKTAALLLFLAIIIILNIGGFSKNIKNFFFLISSPIQKSFWQTGRGLSDFFSGILEVKMIKGQLEILELRNRELLGQIVFFKELKKENQFLRESLDIGLEKEFQIMLARIISKDIFQDSILVNKGRKDGILEGWPVITGQKVLLGRIGEVYDNFSEVILISNKQSSFDAKIIEREVYSGDYDGGQEMTKEKNLSEVYGIVRGRGGFKLELDLIPKDREIFENDIVITSALGGIYPAGLLVGEIKAIKKSDLESFQKAEATPLFDIKKLDHLFIVAEF